MARRNYSFDASMQLSDGAAAYTAAGYSQVGGAQAILDLGGNQGITITLPSIADSSTITPQQARIDAVAVIYLSAITVAGSDVYKVAIVGSNTAAVNSSNAILGMLEFGEGANMDCLNGANTTAPAGSGNFPAGNQYELLFTNEQNGVPFEFITMYISGTFGSITFTSFVAVLPRE
jgi:hypothetical protein